MRRLPGRAVAVASMMIARVATIRGRAAGNWSATSCTWACRSSRRGARLAAAFRCGGIEPLEVYPYATLRLLGLPTKGKRTKPGRRIIHDALQPLVPGLAHPDASEHQLDAVVCAYTAHLWRQGRTRTVGVTDEGLMVIPDAPLSEASATSAIA
jgi:predicted nuclease with RNAse H fold